VESELIAEREPAREREACAWACLDERTIENMAGGSL
jgi:hypothetical protein